MKKNNLIMENGRKKTTPTVKRKVQLQSAKKQAKDESLQPRKEQRWEVLKKVISRRIMGQSDEEIRYWLQDWYDYSYDTTNNLIHEAKACMAEKLERYKDKVAEINLSRANTIIEDAYEQGDLNTALKGIDILNKMCGVYTNNINIKSETPIFTIKLGDE